MHESGEAAMGRLAVEYGWIDEALHENLLRQWQRAPHETFVAILEREGGISKERCRQLVAEMERRAGARGNLDKNAAEKLHPDSIRTAADAAANSVPSNQSSMTLAVGVVAEVGAAVPAVGDEGGRFAILRPHAEGGLGEVAVARDRQLDREVAFKQIKRPYASDPKVQRRFRLEAEVTGNLEHPGIVPVYSLGAFPDGRPFYAMRFVRGESLRDAVARFHLAPNFASLEFRNLLRRFVDVCNAIGYAHSRGILHRDLKPGNIMLGEFGETLVVDWGLAKRIGQTTSLDEPPDAATPQIDGAAADAQLTEPGSTLGTPAFMSPEQIEGEADEVGPLADVYGLGATLYAILTGRAPFAGPSALGVLTDVVKGRLAPPRQIAARVPAPLEAVCLKAMALEPTNRHAGALELAVEVERWLADEPVGAFREPFFVRARRWLRKHPGPAAAVAAALFVGLTGTAFWSAAMSRKNVELHAALEREALQKAKADAEFRRAKAAIDEYLVAVAESPQLRERFPGMQEFRADLLSKAQRYYDAFLSERGDDANLSLDAAAASFQRAVATGELGNRGEALASFEAAEKRYAALVDDPAAAAPPLAELARVRNAQGLVLRELGRPAEAAAKLGQARATFERLAIGPEAAQYRNNLAGTLNNLARVYAETGQFAEAAVAYSEARSIYERAVKEHPEAQQPAVDLAKVCINHAILQMRLGQATAALAGYRRAIALRERLAAANPMSADYASELATAYNNLGMLQTALGDTAEAESHNRKALVTRERLVRENPGIPQYALGLARSHMSIGMLQVAADDRKTALESFRMALAIQEKLVRDRPEAVEYVIETAGNVVNVADALRETGKAADAATHYQRAIELLQESAKQSVTARSFLMSAHWGRGKTRAKLGSWSEALADFDIALKLDAGKKAAAIRRDRDAAQAAQAAQKRARP